MVTKTQNFNSKFNDLKKELQKVKQQLEDLTENEFSEENARNIKNIIYGAVDNLNDFLESRANEFSNFFEGKKQNFYDQKEKYSDRIKANPFLAILGATAIGALIGIIVKR